MHWPSMDDISVHQGEMIPFHYESELGRLGVVNTPLEMVNKAKTLYVGMFAGFESGLISTTTLDNFIRNSKLLTVRILKNDHYPNFDTPEVSFSVIDFDKAKEDASKRCAKL